jgi:hypothetical protein
MRREPAIRDDFRQMSQAMRRTKKRIGQQSTATQGNNHARYDECRKQEKK